MSVSLFDLNVDAPVLQGLSLVRHPPGETLAQALRTSCPGIREDLGWTHEEHDRALCRLFCSSRENIQFGIPGLGALVDITFHGIKFTLNSPNLYVVSSTGPSN